MKEIILRSGGVALVDKADFDYLDQFKWHKSSNGYAMTTIKGKTVYMHRMIMNTPDDMDTHHKNHNRLDNQKQNLEVCSRSENLKLRKTYSRSGQKHIYHLPKRKNGQWVYQRYFDNLADALAFSKGTQ